MPRFEPILLAHLIVIVDDIDPGGVRTSGEHLSSKWACQVVWSGQGCAKTKEPVVWHLQSSWHDERTPAAAHTHERMRELCIAISSGDDSYDHRQGCM